MSAVSNEEAGVPPGVLPRPVFLVGAERSGTTMLRLMIDSHPEWAWCNEFEYAVDRVPDGDGWPDLDAYYAWLDLHRIFRATGFELDRALDYPALVESFLLQRQESDGATRVGATVHRHFDRLLRIWPEASFIHIVRDGRDVAASCIKMGWAGNAWTASRRWAEAEDLWEALQGRVPASRRLELRYEQLAADPEAQLRRVCDFLQVGYAPSMLEYQETTTYDAPDPSIGGTWRQKFGDEDIQLIEARIGDRLVERGYPSSGLPAIEVGEHERRRLLRHDQRERFRFRVRRYGLPLVLREMIARRVGLHSMHRAAQLRINETQRAHLK